MVGLAVSHLRFAGLDAEQKGIAFGNGDVNLFILQTLPKQFLLQYYLLLKQHRLCLILQAVFQIIAKIHQQFLLISHISHAQYVPVDLQHPGEEVRPEGDCLSLSHFQTIEEESIVDPEGGVK